MGIVFRQSVKTSIVTFTGAVLGALIIWLSTKYIIDKQQFGFNRFLLSQTIVIAQILLIGLHNTLLVHVHKYPDEHDKRKFLITSSIIIPFIFLLIVLIPFFSFKNFIINHFQPQDIPYIRRYYIYFPIFILSFIYQVLLEQYLGSQLKVAIAAFMREVLLRIFNIALVLLFGFDFIDFDQFILLSTAVNFIPVIIFFILSIKTKAFGISFNIKSFNPAELKYLVHFTWYHFMLTISILLIGAMDILALPYYDKSGLNSVAIYSVTVYLITLLQMPLRAMGPATFSVLAKSFADNDIAKAKDVFNRSSLNMLIATTVMSVLLLCNIHNAVEVIKNGYGAIAVLFAILFIGKYVDLSTGINDQVLSITNYYKFNFYLSLGLMFILFFMLRTLIPIYGIYGAAWSSTITLILFNIAKFLFVWKKLGMQPYSVGSLKIVAAGAVTALVGYFIPFMHDPYTDTIVRTGVIITVYVAGLLVLKPSPDLTEYMASIRKNKRLF